MPFVATQNGDGTVTIDLALTVTVEDPADAAFVMKRIREITNARGRSVAQGDFITTISVLDEKEQP